MHFQVGALPVVENQFLKHFSNKVLYNYCSKFFLERFGQYLKKSKMDFQMNFKNVISKWHKVLIEIDDECFRVFGPYFIGK